jgi:hypothetical protein
MPTTPSPSLKSSQEAAFAAAFPQFADMSTSGIRELQAFATASLKAKAKDIRRREALAEWEREHLAPLPLS